MSAPVLVARAHTKHNESARIGATATLTDVAEAELESIARGRPSASATAS